MFAALFVTSTDSHFFAISNFVYQMLFSSQLYLKRVDQFLKSLAICWSIKRITRILAESSSSWFKVQNILNAIWAVVSWFCSILSVWAPRQRWIVVPLLSLKLTLRTAFFACHCVCWPIGQAVPEIYVKRKREQNRKGRELLNKTTVFLLLSHEEMIGQEKTWSTWMDSVGSNSRRWQMKKGKKGHKY